MSYLEQELASEEIGDLAALVREDAPYPMSVDDRVRCAHDDLSLGETRGTVTKLGSDPSDGAVVYDIAWDDGTASTAVRGFGLRCVTVLEASSSAPLSNLHRRPGESLSAWGKRLKAGDASLATKQKKRTRSGGSSTSFSQAHPRGRGGQWIYKSGSSGTEVRSIQSKVGAKVDGQYGAGTKQAVERFQRKHGLVVDGVVGAQTVAAMMGKRRASQVKTGKMSAADRRWLTGLRHK